MKYLELFNCNLTSVPRGATFEVLPFSSYALSPSDTVTVGNIFGSPVSAVFTPQ